MTDKVHVHSEALGRDFTFKEWCDYLKEHPNASSIPVVECGLFQFNVLDVCLNPQEPISESERGWGFKVQVAQSPNGRWSSAGCWFIPNASHSSLPCYIDSASDGFDTMAGAIRGALNEILGAFTREKAPKEAIIRVKTLRTKFMVIQQTLF